MVGTCGVTFSESYQATTPVHRGALCTFGQIFFPFVPGPRGYHEAMAPILNALAELMCDHGGTFKVIPDSAPTIIVGGAPVLTMADIVVPQTPCPFNYAGVPAPCVTAEPIPGTGALMVTAMGIPVLLETTQFLTIGGEPCDAMVVFPGQVLVEGT